MRDQKQLLNVECFIYLGSTITNGARYTHATKFTIAIAKQLSTRRRLLLPANWT